MRQLALREPGGRSQCSIVFPDDHRCRVAGLRRLPCRRDPPSTGLQHLVEATPVALTAPAILLSIPCGVAAGHLGTERGSAKGGGTHGRQQERLRRRADQAGE